jgi:hypothetical protein
MRAALLAASVRWLLPLWALVFVAALALTGGRP